MKRSASAPESPKALRANLDNIFDMEQPEKPIQSKGKVDPPLADLPHVSVLHILHLKYAILSELMNYLKLHDLGTIPNELSAWYFVC